MSQAVLISDNEVINSLFELNLRAYVAVNINIKPDIESAVALLEHIPNLDAIIVFKNLSNDPGDLSVLEKFLAKKKMKVPLILMGDHAKGHKQAIYIKNKYNIKQLLQSMAKLLELTAVQMASREVPNYFPIPIRLLKNMESSYYDLYSRKQKEDFEYDYEQVIEKSIPFGDKLNSFIQKDEDYLYIDSQFRLKFINKVSSFMIDELNKPDLSTEEKIEITAQGHSMVAQEVFDDPKVSEAVVAVSNTCIKAMINVVKDVPKLRGLLTMLMENQGDYIFKHGVVATFIASQMIEKMSWGSKEQIDKVAFSIFFHDLFLVPIYQKYPDAISEEDLLFREDVSTEDKEVILNHAKYAGEMIQSFPRAPMGADMIISQHHGMMNGRGFAVNYKDDISPLSKVIIIAEDTANGILQDIADGNKKDSLNPEKLIKRLNARYTYQSYRKIIATISEIQL